MPLKRKRRVSLTPEGLAPGEPLKRITLPGTSSSSWSWVGSDVVDPTDITHEQRLMTLGLSKRNNFPCCRNKYSPQIQEDLAGSCERPSVNGELENDIIILSDDEEHECTLKRCKLNPNCLNYLGQDEWENESIATENFLKGTRLGDNPVINERESDYPVGLRNLGATCYANASLQVWFRDLKFRGGVYSCQPQPEAEEKFQDSPIFQLQVTFAALQESTQSVFNPVKLVESLHLRTTEQQDAQEFSKLFMSHLDAEFKKQAVPAVECLVTDQFQGKQIYGTMCNQCHYRSERTSDFLEIEINLRNNSSLEDQISALLEPETLSGDNQYLCPQCESLQDATRYTELRELPPILHFSLLRFVYDVSVMERKKSKHAISFPMSLDMSKFLGSTDQAASYELRGILLHKGPSAYRGHYEAQVYDTAKQSWYQFNDEVVSKIKSLGEHKPKPNVIDIDDIEDKSEQLHASRIQKSRANGRKRRKVDNDSFDDKDEDIQIITAKPNLSENRRITSKDAYMLIYSRPEPQATPSKNGEVQTTIPVPPPRALAVVNLLNAAHEEASSTFKSKENLVKSRFQQRRREVMGIYHTWNVQSEDEPSVIVSQQALKRWLSQYMNEPVLIEDSGKPPYGNGEVASERVIMMDDILCSHERLDPNKAKNIKRICKKAYARIVRETGYVFQPSLTTNHVCDICVERGVRERLYQIEHPRLVCEFDRISEVISESKGYWISKAWLKDWKLMKPKMHITSEGDPAPDSPEFDAHVRCEHQGLSLNTMNRRKISVEGMKFLQRLYPSWNPVCTDVEVCPVCDALVHISKENKREVRKRAESEKALLKYMYDHGPTGTMISEIPDTEPYAIIPIDFLKLWHQWIDRPTEGLRPQSVENAPFICEHDLLNFDPNSTDFDSSFGLIKRTEWDALKKLYPGGPLINIEKRSREGAEGSTWTHEPAVCIDCRSKRISDWTTAEITVRLRDTNDTDGNKKIKKSLTYTRKAGTRQSRRLRQTKGFGGGYKLTVTKSTTVREMKVILQRELDIPTICQKLLHRGQELDDNSATVATLQIFANDILDLHEQVETIDINSDNEERQSRDEGRGFGGTLLGGSPGHTQEPPEGDKRVDVMEKSCSTCTFLNDPTASSCTMCDTTLV